MGKKKITAFISILQVMLTLRRVTFQMNVQVTSSLGISETKNIDILHKRKQNTLISYINVNKQNKQEKIK